MASSQSAATGSAQFVTMGSAQSAFGQSLESLGCTPSGAKLAKRGLRRALARQNTIDANTAVKLVRECSARRVTVASLADGTALLALAQEHCDAFVELFGAVRTAWRQPDASALVLRVPALPRTCYLSALLKRPSKRTSLASRSPMSSIASRNRSSASGEWHFTGSAQAEMIMVTAVAGLKISNVFASRRLGMTSIEKRVPSRLSISSYVPHPAKIFPGPTHRRRSVTRVSLANLHTLCSV